MANLISDLAAACGRALPIEGVDRRGRTRLVIGALLASLVLAAIWGLAAGSSSLTLALGNLYKVPMVVLLSCLAAIPAGLVAWRLSDQEGRPSVLVAGFAAGVLNGALVLAVLSPVVALYYHSSASAGPVLALGSVFLSLVVATLVFFRAVTRPSEDGPRSFAALMPVGVVVVMQLVTLLQLIALASPILPETTVFDGGIDELVTRSQR